VEGFERHRFACILWAQLPSDKIFVDTSKRYCSECAFNPYIFQVTS
jgi:hypothetical protein